MDTEDFLNTKYAKQLLRDADLIGTELGQFNARWVRLQWSFPGCLPCSASFESTTGLP